MQDENDLGAIEAIYDALEGGDPASALELARRARAQDGQDPDPVLCFLAGRALLELDRPSPAAEELRQATSLDPDDPEFRAYLAWALFRAARFQEATEELDRSLALDDRLAEAHYVAGLIFERQAELARADKSFARAAELAPEWFEQPRRFSQEEFGRQLELARRGLRKEFRSHLDHLTLIVDDLPSNELIFEDEPPLDPEQTLGLFAGVPLDQQSSQSTGGELPARIYLFKRNLERSTPAAEELAEQIRVTLFHELGHYLGMDEAQLEDSGYA